MKQENKPIKQDKDLAGYLDNPVNQERGYYRFYFNGWIHPFQKFDNIEIMLGDNQHHNYIIRRMKRPDLNSAFPDILHAENGGFEGIITVGDKEGTYRFIINIITDTNQRIEIGRRTVINTKKIIYEPPILLALGVVSHCNISCEMCPKHSHYSTIKLKGDVMEKKLVNQILCQLKNFSPSLEKIGFQDYGEPFLYKDIFKITDQVANILPDCNIGITTNGLLLNDELIEKVIQSKISSVVFSLDAANESTYQQIREGGDFSKVINNIKLLLSKRGLLKLNRPYIAMNFVIMRSNLDEISDYIKLGESLNVDGIGFVFPFGLFESDKDTVLKTLHEEDNEYSKRYSTIKSQLEISDTSKKKRYFLPNIQPNELILDCSFNGKRQFYIDTTGDVYPCCVIAAKGQEEDVNSHAMGNVNDQSLQEIWESSKFVNFRERFYKGEYPHEVCKICPKYYGI